MNTFKNVEKISFSPSITWLIGQIMEARGKQDLWIQTKPEIMKNLKEIAIVQSAESSNRIEGVEVERNRLAPLLAGKVKPMDRPEEEVLGYKNALSFIHSNYEKIEIRPAVIKKLHELAQGGFSGDAGRWKKSNNEIIEILPTGENIIRFSPVSAKDTPKYIDQLCLVYRNVHQQDKLPDLISIASFIFDFLCIHPFRDGNGRVSRLLTFLLLYQSSYHVGRYISIERIIEETKENYYEVLKQSSMNWHDAKHDPSKWWYYFLSTVKSAYRELEEKVKNLGTLDNKTNLIRGIIMEQITPFTLSDIQKLAPSVSPQMIKKITSKLKEEGVLKLHGKGRGAKWQKK